MSPLSIYSQATRYFMLYCLKSYIMCARGSSVCFYLLISVVHSSSIFTRSMIKMPDQPHSPLITQKPNNTTAETMILTSKSDGKRYEIIYPLKLRSEQTLDDQSRSWNEEQRVDFHKDIFSEAELQKENSEPKSTSSEFANVKQFQNTSEYNLTDGSIASKELEGDKASLKNIPNSPVKYLGSKHQNLSSNVDNSLDFFRGTQEFSSKTEKGFQAFNLWIVLQKIFNCGWSSRWLSCVQESFGTTSDDSFFLYNLLVPREPSNQLDEESSEEYPDHKDTSDITDQDEGRKSLSKKLQSLLPLLMMLKMSMLPALAVMALVSGKAFIMSLISLGVALFSAVFSPKDILSASKRNEILPQSPIPLDKTASNYYYMM